MAEQKTLPTGTTIIKKGITVTRDNFGTSYHYGHDGNYDWYGSGYPVAYGTSPTVYPTKNPRGEANTELLNQYDSATWFRNFYPSIETLYDATSLLSATALTGLLTEADYHHTNGKKLLMAGFWWHALPTILGQGIDTAEYEQILYDALLALLTSTATSPTHGFTFANHPAIGGFEFANEQINAQTVPFADSYARATRIVYQLFKLYKPACQLVNFCAIGGNGGNVHAILNGNAESIISPKLAVDGDDGTGKTTADYMDVFTWHFYQVNVETEAQLAQDFADNGISTRNNLYISENHFKNSMRAQRDLVPASPFYGVSIDKPLWNTESGMNPQESTKSHLGGARWFKLTQSKGFEYLMRWGVPSLMATSDGAGGLGVWIAYKSDLPGCDYSGSGFGTSGTISNIQNGIEGIRFTSSGTGAQNGWEENMRIVITAPTGGWSDLGLAAGEKKRYSIHIVDLNSRTLELKETAFTTAPTGTIAYTEYQLSHSPYPEEFKEWVDLMISGDVTYGLITYVGQKHKGLYVHVEGQGAWYTDKDGNFKKW